ncbi:MAG: hypothetical protein ACR2NP_09415 [Pirellulaceae bacterium]
MKRKIYLAAALCALTISTISTETWGQGVRSDGGQSSGSASSNRGETRDWVLPIGFERFWDLPESVASYPTTIGHPYYYTDPLITFGKPWKRHNDNNTFRIIDIEPRRLWTSSGKQAVAGELQYDMVLMENKGKFARSSWFTEGLSAEGVRLLKQIPGIVLLDIERIPDPSSDQLGDPADLFAVIAQENPADFDWKVLVGVTLDQIEDAMEDDDYRPIDVDIYRSPLSQHYPDYILPIYDCILVRNIDENFVDTKLDYPANYELEKMAEDGWQATDHEYTSEQWQDVFPDSEFLTILVRPGRTYWLTPMMNAAEILDVDTYNGRVVDIQYHARESYWAPAYTAIAID